MQTRQLKLDVKRAGELRETERKGRINVERKLKEKVDQARDEYGYTFRAIGHVESIYVERRGTPRQPILVTSGRGRIVFNKHLIQYEHYKELEEFSHIWVVFVFHDNTNADKEISYLKDAGGKVKEQSSQNKNRKGSKGVNAKIAPPRLHGAKVGCLSTRSPHRPNPIGLSVCTVESVNKDAIIVSGLDMIDGTPVLDVKPYIPYDIINSTIPIPMAVDECGNTLNCKLLHVPSWIHEYDIPSRKIVYSTESSNSLEFIVNSNKNSRNRGRNRSKSTSSLMYSNVNDMKNLISQILRQDIRSVYQGRKAPDDDDAKGQEIKPSVAVTGEYAGEEKEDVGQSYEVNIGTLHLVFYTHQSHIFIKSISNH